MMEGFIKKKAIAVVDEHPEVLKLIQLYNDEFASGDSEPDDSDSASRSSSGVS